jgi:hypothetical protein
VKRHFSSPKSHILYLSSIPWFIFLKFFILGISPTRVWTRLIWKDYYLCHTKSGNSSSPKKFEMKGLNNHQFEPRSKMEWSLSWKFLTPSLNHFMLRNHFSLSSSSLRKALENPFEEFLQYLFHSFPYPIISILIEIDFLVKYGIYLSLFHHIFPRKEIVHLGTIFQSVCADRSDWFFTPVRPVWLVYERAWDLLSPE